jgi:hypothetical protein
MQIPDGLGQVGAESAFLSAGFHVTDEISRLAANCAQSAGFCSDAFARDRNFINIKPPIGLLVASKLLFWTTIVAREAGPRSRREQRH